MWLLYYSEPLIKGAGEMQEFANVIKGEVELKNEDSSAGRD